MILKQNFGRLLSMALVIFALAKIIPTFLSNSQAEDKRPPHFQMRTDDGTVIDSKGIQGPVVLAFWATWCGPCTIELARLNRLIVKGEISKDSVIAISMGEDPALVSQTVKQRGYLFRNLQDVDHSAASAFQVQGTPTVVFLGRDESVAWLTTGLSPLLELRVKHFLL